MTATSTRKKTKKYLYFTIDKNKKLYLGTADAPKVRRIEEAVVQLRAKIRKYEDEVRRLEGLVHREAQDYNIVYRLVVFDLDGVIFDKPWHATGSDKVAVSTWDVLFQKLDIYDSHEKLKHQFENGDFTYMEWTERACNVLKSFLDKKTFEDVINGRPLMEGAPEVFSILRQNTVKTAVITGSFYELAQRAKKELGGIDHILAHATMKFSNKGLLEHCDLQSTDYEDKASWVRKICEKETITLAECAYIGDDVNDVPAFKEVGLSISFNSNKRAVNEAAKVVIENRDLRSVLPHLCVKR